MGSGSAANTKTLDFTSTRSGHTAVITTPTWGPAFFKLGGGAFGFGLQPGDLAAAEALQA